MAHPRAFVSFDFDNNKNSRDFFCGQAKNSRTPFDIQDWSSKAVLPQNQWEELIQAKINRCNMLIVLVGKSTYLATGVIKEIRFAKEQNVPIFGVYVDSADSNTPLPEGLPRYKTVDWEWTRIADAVDAAMKQGKNA